MINLYKQLKKYKKSKVYPFHMPGHKRRVGWLKKPYKIDITEIDGFDNLHHANGILLKAQQKAAMVWGARECFYLVNGSTCGLLSAICGVTKKGDKVLIARNCHKSVFHALYLNELEAQYLMPRIDKDQIAKEIQPEDVEQALKNSPDIKCVVITSPTYEGFVSDIKSISSIAHKYGIPLIVDQAHGAHLGFHPYFPPSAVKEGADMVIVSLHKTMPSLTMTALLFINSNMIDSEKIKEKLAIFQTSSPSYVLMASMDLCVTKLIKKEEKYFKKYVKKLEKFYNSLGSLKHLQVYKNIEQKDPSKILISTSKTSESGLWLMERLRKEYKLEMEMSTGSYVLGMTSMMDSKKGLKRLKKALQKIDQELVNRQASREQEDFECNSILYEEKNQIKNIYQGMESDWEVVALEDAKGRISGEFISIYPPGIPILLPGEEITSNFVEYLMLAMERGENIIGLMDGCNIKVNRL